jgi:hypothetical protein
MTRQPWYRTTPLYLMDSNPRDEEPEPQEDDDGACPMCGVDHERHEKCADDYDGGDE